jgi:hypothetical protein
MLPARKMLEVCFSHLGVEALYLLPEREPQRIKVLIKQPDQVTSLHEARILNSTHLFEILREDCPQPLRGERIQIEGEVFTIQHVESSDHLQLVWTVEAVKQ